MKNLLFALVLFTIASCSSKSYPDKNWDGKQWTLVEIMNVPVQTAGSVEDAHLVFDSQKSMISGTGGCNRIFGSYEIGKKNMLKFGDIGSTMMACQDLPFENKFLEVLKSVRYYEVSAGELFLKDGNKKIVLKLQ